MADDRLQMLQKARQILTDQRVEIAREIVKVGSSGPIEWDHLHRLDLALQSLDIAINDEGRESAPQAPGTPWDDDDASAGLKLPRGEG